MTDTSLPPCLHSLSEEALAQLDGTRSEAQFATMLAKLREEACNFCPEHFDHATNKILYENPRWMVWECPPQYMRKELGLHLLIVPHRHVRFPWELSLYAFMLLFFVWRFVKRRYADRIPGGGIITRIGDMRYNAGTVAHLHMNVWVPNRTGEVRTPLYKIDEHAAASRERMLGFAANYEAANAK